MRIFIMKINKILITFCIACTAWATALFAQPVVTGLSPNFGPTAGGTTITITGSGFTGVTSVKFGTTSASFTFVNDTTITAISPSNQTPGAEQVSVTVGSNTSPFTQFAYFVYQGDWFGYVPIFSTVSPNYIMSVFDATLAAHPVTDTFSTPGQLRNFLSTNAITPNAKASYVTSAAIASRAPESFPVFPINLQTNTFGTSFILNNPFSIAITPDGTSAYISAFESVAVVSTSTNAVIDTISLPSSSFNFDIALTPDGTKGYVTDAVNSVINVIDIPANTVRTGPGYPIPIGASPVALAVTPNGKKVYVANSGDSTVSVIDTSTDTVLTTITVGNNPEGIAITPDGSTAYVTNQGDGTISVINTATDMLVTTMLGFSSPFVVTIAPDGLTGYVVDFSPVITTFSPATNTITGAVALANGDDAVITPDQAPLALFKVLTMAGSSITFDATLSKSPTGTIASYFWNFGDGQTLTTTSPIVTHAYATGGSFTVTLTVTNTAGTSTTQVFTGHTMSRNGGPAATFSQTIQIGPTTPAAPSSFNFQVVKKKCKEDDKEKHRKKKHDDDDCCFTYTHILSFKKSPDPTVIAYQLVRNGRLIKTIPASGPFVVFDKRGKKRRKDTYVLVAVNASNQRSTPLSVVIPKRKICKKDRD